MRRTFTLAAAALLLARSSTASAQILTVAVYEGEWGEAIKACFVEPFVKSTHINITPAPGMSTDTLDKLSRQKANPAIDVAWMDAAVSELAEAANLVAAIDPRRVPNVGTMLAEGVHKTASGAIYALSTGFVSFGLVYNTLEVEARPSSWWDLWKPEFNGRSTVPSPTNPMGVPLLLHLNTLLGGTPANLDPAIKRYKELKVSSFANNLVDATNGLRSGKDSIGAQYAAMAWKLADDGLPITYVSPMDGALGTDIRVHIVRGGTKHALAERFVNFSVAKEQASCMAERMYVGPATKGVALSDKAKARMPWGKDGSIANLAIIDWEEVSRVRQDVTNAWTKEFKGK
jgi:putative spermidine/putrescine transport system substrate-binding protein